MSALFTTDYLAAEALTICKAAGMLAEETEVEATITRKRDGSSRYDVTVWDTNASRNPLDCHKALVLAAGFEAALGALAEKLGVAWPIWPITADQKQELIRLGNHQYTTRPEKTELLLNMHQLTEQQAKAKIDAFRLVLDGRYPQNYGLAAEAYQVRPAA